MAKVVLGRRAVADLDRFFEFLVDKDPLAAVQSRRAIIDALKVLATSPRVGRPVASGLRELVISWGQTGYVAMYRFSRRHDRVLVLTLRQQREVLSEDS